MIKDDVLVGIVSGGQAAGATCVLREVRRITQFSACRFQNLSHIPWCLAGEQALAGSLDILGSLFVSKSLSQGLENINPGICRISKSL